jgi:hypothetical protein
MNRGSVLRNAAKSAAPREFVRSLAPSGFDHVEEIRRECRAKTLESADMSKPDDGENHRPADKYERLYHVGIDHRRETPRDGVHAGRQHE